MSSPAVKSLYNNGKRCNNAPNNERRLDSKSGKTNALQRYNQYMAMADESMIAGDRIAAEYLYQ